MLLKETDIKRIENFTLDILVEAVGKLDSVVPPIDVLKVADKYDIALKTGEFKDKTIIGAYDKPEKAIYLAEDTHATRKVFTIAHELGHYFLHKDKKSEVFFRSDMLNLENSGQLEESEANWFAASLLMPEAMVRRFMTVFRTHWEIAELFGVSNSAAYYRLKNLNLVE